MTLSDWARNGWLRPHTATASEIAELFVVAQRDLEDVAAAGLSDDWRFAIAYNAALQVARIALLASGYETPKGENAHFRAIQSLTLTLKVGESTVRALDAYRKKRAASIYEVAGRITESDAREMITLARDLEKRARQWIRTEHPALAPG